MTGVIINNNEYQVSTGNTKIEYNAMGGESVGYSMYGDEVPYTEIYEWVPYVIPSTSTSYTKYYSINIKDAYDEYITVGCNRSMPLNVLFDNVTAGDAFCVLEPSRSDSWSNYFYITFPCELKVTDLSFSVSGYYSGSVYEPSSVVYYDKDENVVEKGEEGVICKKLVINGWSYNYFAVKEIYVTAYKQVKKS